MGFSKNLKEGSSKGRRGSIKSVLLIIVAIGMVLVFCGTQFTNTVKLQSTIASNVRTTLSNSSRDNASIMNLWIQNQASKIQAIADSLADSNSDDPDYVMDYLEAALAKNDNALMYYATFGDTAEVFPADHSEVDLDPKTRPWYSGAVDKDGDVYCTEPYTDAVTQQSVVSLAVCVTINNRESVILADITIDELVNQLNTLAENDTRLEPFLLTADGNIISHTNSDYLPTDESSYNYTEISNIDLTATDVTTFIDYDGQTKYVALATVENNGWIVGVAESSSYIASDVLSQLPKTVAISLIVLIVIIVLFVIAINKMLKPLEKVENAITKMSKGDFDVELSGRISNNEIGRLNLAAKTLTDNFKEIVVEEKRVLGSIAKFDLTCEDMKEFDGEFNEIASSVNNIKNMLADLLHEIKESAMQVGIGSREIADATNNLSAGTVMQASSIDQVVTDIDDIADRIHNNYENERTVKNKLHQLDELIQDGNKEMSELIRVVTEVETMSNDIEKIISSIDSIAFQTNILALNASVEAARAGENGRGFAVVADEVGNLAGKTGESSKQTSNLIQQCIEGIKESAKFADSTNKCLKEIVENSAEIAKAFDEIAEATKIQEEKSMNIKVAIDNISDVVQTNTATSQQTAAATQELSAQAQSMSGVVENFIV